MKYCGECGTQLEDNDVFCEECGARQDTIVSAQLEYRNDTDDVVVPAQEIGTANVVRDMESTLGKTLPGWVVLTTLILCSPLILAFWAVELFFFLPEVLFWGVFFGLQVVALAMMFSKKRWPMWVKVIVLVLYVLSYVI